MQQIVTQSSWRQWRQTDRQTDRQYYTTNCNTKQLETVETDRQYYATNCDTKQLETVETDRQAVLYNKL